MPIQMYPIKCDNLSKLNKSYTEYYEDKIFKSLGVPLKYINPDLIIDMEADYISEDIPY